MTDSVIQGQFILGLQADERDDTHKCYKSYILYKDTYGLLPTFKEMQFSKIDDNSQALLNYGGYLKQAKAYISQYILGFNVYK